jgi:hypothetical protein
VPGCLRPRPLGCSHRPSASGPRAMTEIADPASSPRVSGSDPSARIAWRIVHGPVSPADPVDSAARGSDASAVAAVIYVYYFFIFRDFLSSRTHSVLLIIMKCKFIHMSRLAALAAARRGRSTASISLLSRSRSARYRFA